MLTPRCTASILMMLAIPGLTLCPNATRAQSVVTLPGATTVVDADEKSQDVKLDAIDLVESEEPETPGTPAIEAAPSSCCSSSGDCGKKSCCESSCCDQSSCCSNGCCKKGGCGKGRRRCCPYQDNCFYSRRCKKNCCGPRRVQYVIVSGGQSAIGTMCNWRTEANFNPSLPKSDVYVDWTVRRDVYPRSTTPMPVPNDMTAPQQDSMLAKTAEPAVEQHASLSSTKLVPPPAAPTGGEKDAEVKSSGKFAPIYQIEKSTPVEPKGKYLPIELSSPEPSQLIPLPKISETKATTSPLPVPAPQSMQPKMRKTPSRKVFSPKPTSAMTSPKVSKLPKATYPPNKKATTGPSLGWSSPSSKGGSTSEKEVVQSIEMVTMEETYVEEESDPADEGTKSSSPSGGVKKVRRTFSSKGSVQPATIVDNEPTFSATIKMQAEKESSRRPRKSGFRRVLSRLFKSEEKPAVYKSKSDSSTADEEVVKTSYSETEPAMKEPTTNEPTFWVTTGTPKKPVSMKPTTSQAPKLEALPNTIQGSTKKSSQDSWSTGFRGWEDE